MKSIFHTLRDTIDQFQVKKIDLTEEQLKEKELCEQSFYEFCKRAWKQVEGSDLIDGWHIEAICAHLEALYDMEIKNLLINIPFRTGKSMFCSVLFPAWVWTQDASESFIYASYAEDLATRDNEKTLALIKTDWYQSLWGNEVQPKKGKANKKSFILKSGGRRRVTSVRGAATGYGANFIICFPFETMIQTNQGLIPIGEIVERNMKVDILSFNHEENRLEYRSILDYMKNEPTELVEIDFGDSKLQCTANHPIYVERKGYIQAIDLKEGDNVLYMPDMPNRV